MSDAFKDFRVMQKKVDKYLAAMEETPSVRVEVEHLREKIKTLMRKMSTQERAEASRCVVDINHKLSQS
jgi:low affinity Fe/Cu permease